MTPTPEQIQAARDRLADGDDLSLADCQTLLDAAAQLAQLRAILDRVRPLEAAATPAPWNVVWTGQHDYDLAIAARNAVAEMLRVTGGQP
jgi:hypothetical protein